MFSRLIAEDINAKNISGENKNDLIEYEISSPNGKAIENRTAIQDEIRDIMQKSYFVYPDYDNAEKGLARIIEIKTELENGGYEINADYTETKSLATVAYIILKEILDRRNEE